jgi:hypothetical protein
MGLIWFGLVWFGLVWFGLVWFGLVWFGLVAPCLVWWHHVWLAFVGSRLTNNKHKNRKMLCALALDGQKLMRRCNNKSVVSGRLGCIFLFSGIYFLGPKNRS